MNISKALVFVAIMTLPFSMCAESPAQLQRKTYTFKKVGSLEIKADVFRPDDQQVRPVVAWLHGGALINGHRESVPKWLADACRERKYILVSFDYRLAPETQLPGIIQDVEDGFTWLAEKGPELFQADPAHIAVVGGSAGGYLTLTAGFRARPRPVALVALWGYGDLVGPWFSEPSPHARHQRTKLTMQEAWQQVSGPPVSDSRDRKGDGGAFYLFCRQQGSWPKAVTGWHPQTDERKFIPYMPARNIGSSFPPTLLIHGAEDTDVPFEQSTLMAAEFARHKVPHELIRVAKAEHGLAGADQALIDDAYRRAIEFLAENLERLPPH